MIKKNHCIFVDIEINTLTGLLKRTLCIATSLATIVNSTESPPLSGSVLLPLPSLLAILRCRTVQFVYLLHSTPPLKLDPQK
jgi:hypothetical protein